MKKSFLSQLNNPKTVFLVIFMLTFFLLSLIIVKLHSHELDEDHKKVASIAADYSYTIKFNLDRALSATYTIQALLSQSNYTIISNFEDIVKEILPSYPGVIELAIAPRGIVQQVAPLKGNEKVLGVNLFEISTQKKESIVAKESAKLTLAGPLELIQGGIGVVGRLPIFAVKNHQEYFWGLAVAVIDISAIFENVKIAQFGDKNLSYEVWRINPNTGLKQIIFHSTKMPLHDPLDYTFDVPNNQWVISIAPEHGWVNRSELIVRVLIAFILAFSVGFMAKLLVDLKIAKRALETKVLETMDERDTLERQLEIMLDAIPDLLWFKDVNGIYLFCNKAFERLYGAKEVDIIGKTDYDFIDSAVADFFRANDLVAIDSKSSVRNEEELCFKDGGYKGLFETIKTPVYGMQGDLIGVFGLSRNITERKENEVKIQQLEYSDPLTKLPNTVQLRLRVEHDLGIMERNHEQLAVFFIDLDHFKNINDTLGHAIGDELLVKISKRLNQLLRPGDTLSRQGGDEFILVLPSVNVDDATHMAKRLLQTIEQPIELKDHELIITASIGITLYPNDGKDSDTLFKYADAAMYLAKKDGRNNYRFFTTEIQKHSSRLLSLENALRYAYTRGELSLHYQPQVSLSDGKIIGVEALLRWQHPELGMISPSEFIPIAEESGQILLIGEWVMRSATIRMKQWLDMGFSLMSVSVNLSTVQFHHAQLSKLIRTILDEANLPPSCLEIELTESAAAQNPVYAIETMNELHEQGIRLSIDDFGTGYSSLSYLKRFKVYKLKIDQSFIHDIHIDPEDKAIVKTIIALGKSLGLKVIAEGVETKEQLDFLKENGCDEAQGYYFSKPLNVTDIEALLRSPEIIARKNNNSLQ